MLEVILTTLKGPLLVVLGFLIGLVPGMRQRRRQAKGHLAVIDVELTQSEQACQEFARRAVVAPIYRLPMPGTNAALPWLIAEGYLEPDEYDAITRVLMLADQISRGLDRTADAVGPAIQEEHDRVQVKAGHMLQNRDGGPGKIQIAREAVNKARKRMKLA